SKDVHELIERHEAPTISAAVAPVLETRRGRRLGRRTLGHVGNSLLAWSFPFSAVVLSLLMLTLGCQSTGPTKREEIAAGWDQHRAAMKYELAHAELKQGNPSKARPLAQEAVALNPKEPANHELLAKTYIANGDFRAAEQILVTLLVDHPEADGALFLLGTIHEREQEWDLAMDDYRRAISVNDEKLEYLIALAQVQAQSGDSGAAVATMASKSAAFSTDPKYYLAQAELYREASDIKQAITAYKSALRMGCDDPAARAALGQCLHWDGAHEAALEYLTAAIRGIDAPSAALLSAYVGCLLQLDRADEAVSWFQRNQKRAMADSAPLQLLYAQALTQTEDFKAAIRAARKAQSIDPGYADAYLYEGGLLAREEKKSDALAAVEKSLRLQPNSLLAWQYYADMLEKFGEPTSAAQARGMIARLQNGESIPVGRASTAAGT
ncbi:MAG: tetratricopeptide repeat protein, partial [Phycisphaerae bacterium]